MIKIKTYKNTNKDKYLKNINRDDSILLIAKGSKPNNINLIYQPTSEKEVEDIYGESDILTSYRIATDNGARNIFIINCYETTDFIDCVSYISNYNFAFVIPVGIKLSNICYNDSTGEEIYIANYYLENFSEYTNSNIVFTEEHAFKYDDLDSFIMDMHNKVERFKDRNKLSLEKCGRNLIFCANTLENVDYANVVLGAILAKTEIALYPSAIKNYKSIFDLNENDFYDNDIVYFKNNFLTNLTVENLRNLRTENDANKLVVIDRTIKFIERNLEFEFLKGKQFSEYIIMTIQDHIDVFFRKIMNKYIINYKLNSITPKLSNDCTIKLKIDLSIKPLRSIEYINVLMEE